MGSCMESKSKNKLNLDRYSIPYKSSAGSTRYNNTVPHTHNVGIGIMDNEGGNKYL